MRNYVSTSLRGALATKQSSSFFAALDSFAIARNDGRRTLSRHRPALCAIAHWDRTIQYSRALVMEMKGCGVLDTPLEPVIGLAEGETRWRSMTDYGGADGFSSNQRQQLQVPAQNPNDNVAATAIPHRP
jgi:hypothetical protein